MDTDVRPTFLHPRKEAPTIGRGTTTPAPDIVPTKGYTSATVDKQATQPSLPFGQAKSRLGQLRRPTPMRHQSLPKFTSKPLPTTKIATEEGESGTPSIMFAEPPVTSPKHEGGRQSSIYDHPSSPSQSTNTLATGFPAQQAVPLTFNDLPCRAQHLILNDLMVGQSAESAVLLTTLPSPVEGTCESEEDSVRYLSDLEVLCQNLPPVLLVHSNSMTVTMNL